jgi:hypothetical protein
MSKWADPVIGFLALSIATASYAVHDHDPPGNAYGLHRTPTPTSTMPPAVTSTPTATRVPTVTSTPTSTPTVMPTATPVVDCSVRLQTLVDATPGGGVLRAPACVYRETVSIDKPMTLDGQHQAEVRGSDIWTDWTQSGSVWLSAQSYPHVGDDSTAGTAACDQGGPCYVDRFKAFNLEQVFLDGKPLVHVPSSPVSGQFALDASRHVVLADNPAGHTLEVSTRKRWVNVLSDNVTLTNLTMRHAATGAFEHSVSSDLHRGFVVSSSTLADAHGSMAGVGGEGSGGGAHYLNNTLSNAGDLALGGYQGDGVIVQGNTFTHNGYGGWEPNWQGGAVKMVSATNLTLDGNTVADTFGFGLWCDIHCNSVTMSNNRVHDVNESALFFEVSDHAHIFGNTVWHSGSRYGVAAINVSNSGDAEVDHNLVYDTSGPPLWAYYANRSDTDVFRNNVFHDNTVVLLHDMLAIGFGDYGSGIATMSNNRGYGNRFWYPSFNATPGGGGDSRYLSDAEKDAALAGAGIP